MPSPVNKPHTQPTKSLPIPPSVMPIVAPAALLQAHLLSSPPVRITGRQPLQARQIDLNIGSLTHCNGSALVKIDQTTIICGIRGEILPISEIPSYNASDVSRAANKQAQNTSGKRREHYDPIALYNLVVPNIDLSTGCSPSHAMNTAPSTSTQALTQRLYSLLLSSRLLSSSDLEIKYTPPRETNYELSPDDPAYVPDAGVEQVKAYWVLYIDMVCISHGGEGVVFDAAWLATLAALKNTLLPRAWWDGDEGFVLCDSDITQAKDLSIRGMPVPLSFGVFEGLKNTSGHNQVWTLVDMDALEEECCLERGCVVVEVSKTGQVVRLEKAGGGALGVDGVKKLVQVANERGREWTKILEHALRQSSG